MIHRFILILFILLLLFGAYFLWLVLSFFIDPDEIMDSIDDPDSEDLTKQRKNSLLREDTPLMQHVLSYIRNGV